MRRIQRTIASASIPCEGIALIAVLLALSVITLIGLAMTFVSATETLINRNNRARVVNGYAAESGCEEARQRLTAFLSDPSLPLTNPTQVVYVVSDSSINPTSGSAATNPYFDEDYDSGFTASLIPSSLSKPGFAWVRVTQKTERWAHYNLDGASKFSSASNDNADVAVLFGLSRTQSNAEPTEYVNSGVHPAQYAGTPVYQVTTLAKNSAGFTFLSRADISGIPVPPLRAAFCSKDAINIADSAVMVDGVDEGGTSSELSALESQNGISGDLTNVNQAPASTIPFSSFAYNLDALIKMMKPPVSREIEKVAPTITKLSDGSYAGDSLSLGQLPTEGNLSQAAFADGPLTLFNSKGQGILIVNGDLTVSGTFNYYGLIIVKGRVILSGGALPGIEIHGGILASSTAGDQTSTLAGNVKLHNNAAFIQKQFSALGYVRLAYQEGL